MSVGAGSRQVPHVINPQTHQSESKRKAKAENLPAMLFALHRWCREADSDSLAADDLSAASRSSIVCGFNGLMVPREKEERKSSLIILTAEHNDIVWDEQGAANWHVSGRCDFSPPQKPKNKVKLMRLKLNIYNKTQLLNTSFMV